eukprot:TRINITY_DN26560_c0_g1_i1.p1 TRINITY_DN26560_c0_g1~~TRINITY_DN26560_c0_g1_i1.p1  ORF type:complete len:1192 (-),score=217.37 TRINITY_DN26560_c0_g1_i1:69-3644(-)
MTLVYGQRNAIRTARRARAGKLGTGRVQALPKLRETGELVDSGASSPVKESAGTYRQSPRQLHSNPEVVVGSSKPGERRRLEGWQVYKEPPAPVNPESAQPHAKRSAPGSHQKKLPSVATQHSQFQAMYATFSTATPAMTPQSSVGYDIPVSRTSGDFYASSSEFEFIHTPSAGERQVQHYDWRPFSSTVSHVTTPQTALSSLGYDMPMNSASGDFYATRSEFDEFRHSAGMGGWLGPRQDASASSNDLCDHPGQSLRLWSLASPTLPPAPFARAIYDRKPKEGVRDLVLSRRNPLPGVSEASASKPAKRQTKHLFLNFQTGGSSPSSSAPRSSRSTSAERAVRHDELRAAEKGLPEVHTARCRRPTVSSSSKARDSVMPVDAHKQHLADQTASEGKVVILGNAKLKLTTSDSRKSVLAELDVSSLPSKHTTGGRKSTRPVFSHSKAASGNLGSVPSLERTGSGGTLHEAGVGSEDEQGGSTQGRHHSSLTGKLLHQSTAGFAGDSGRSDQLGQEHAIIPSPRAHEAKPHHDNNSQIFKPPNTADKVAYAFKKLSEHNEIHEDDFARALELCGCVRPVDDWIKRVSKSLTDYSTMNLEEFRTFVQGYKAMQHEAYKKAFEDCDNDGSGLVENSELEELLRSFGIEPMEHVMEEVLAEVDEDGRGELDLHEFEHLMDVILSREGFTKSEYEEFMSLFQRFDRDNSGEIDVKELIAMINWLGYTITPSDLQAIVAEVDVDGSGEINKREFLVCMRKLRDRSLKLVMEVIKVNDQDGSGTIDRKELFLVLRGLGYEIADSAAIDESQTEAGLASVDELGLSQLWRILAVYRLREGMTNEEVESIYAAFHAQDKDGSGELETREAPAALRELGYKCDFSVVQNVLGKVDVDDTGALDQVEFRKMVRMVQARDFELFRAVFRDHDTENKNVITQDSAIEAMASFGFTGTPKTLFRWDEIIPVNIPGESEPQKMISIENFVRACDRYAKKMRKTFMTNGGWTDEEVEHYRQIFARYDVWGHGEISSKELVRLVEDTIPEMASDRAMRPQLVGLMKQVNDDLKGSLSFRDFLKLMFGFREFQDKERANKESLAVKETGFSVQEVAEFRELFLASDTSCSGELNFKEVWEMVNTVTPLGDVLSSQLKVMFNEATMRTSIKGDQNQQADFPELLRLMKRLLDINFAGIKEKTEYLGLARS